MNETPQLHIKPWKPISPSLFPLLLSVWHHSLSLLDRKISCICLYIPKHGFFTFQEILYITKYCILKFHLLKLGKTNYVLCIYENCPILQVAFIPGLQRWLNIIRSITKKMHNLSSIIIAIDVKPKEWRVDFLYLFSFLPLPFLLSFSLLFSWSLPLFQFASLFSYIKLVNSQNHA